MTDKKMFHSMKFMYNVAGVDMSVCKHCKAVFETDTVDQRFSRFSILGPKPQCRFLLSRFIGAIFVSATFAGATAALVAVFCAALH